MLLEGRSSRAPLITVEVPNPPPPAADKTSNPPPPVAACLLAPPDRAAGCCAGGFCTCFCGRSFCVLIARLIHPGPPVGAPLPASTQSEAKIRADNARAGVPTTNRAFRQLCMIAMIAMPLDHKGRGKMRKRAKHASTLTTYETTPTPENLNAEYRPGSSLSRPPSSLADEHVRLPLWLEAGAQLTTRGCASTSKPRKPRWRNW